MSIYTNDNNIKIDVIYGGLIPWIGLKSLFWTTTIFICHRLDKHIYLFIYNDIVHKVHRTEHDYSDYILTQQKRRLIVSEHLLAPMWDKDNCLTRKDDKLIKDALFQFLADSNRKLWIVNIHSPITQNIKNVQESLLWCFRILMMRYQVMLF